MVRTYKALDYVLLGIACVALKSNAIEKPYHIVIAVVLQLLIWAIVLKAFNK